MSEQANNREYRKQVIASLIRQLHEGKSVDEVKAQFEEAFAGVSASEISRAEQELVENGLPIAEVQRLCDVHAAVFKGSIEEIHAEPEDPSGMPGHPLQTLRLENHALEDLLTWQVKPRLQAYLAEGGTAAREALVEGLKKLVKIDVHYSKKENLLFPLLEKHGVTAPPKVMWGVDDEVRALLKTGIAALEAGEADADGIKEAVAKIEEMIFKEEHILFPMLLETLTPGEWTLAAQGQEEIGYFLIHAQPAWAAEGEAPQDGAAWAGEVRLPSGALSVDELTRMLNALPIDITFVGADDTVRYFSESRERAFARTRSLVGRKVVNCHPPASMQVVQSILDDFRAGKKEHEDFWIRMGERLLLIRYFAVRDDGGAFIGTLEVTQDIAPIQAITGEKRLMS